MIAAPPARSRSPRSCTRRAFTLVELLVVIAIIALLIGILLPSLASSRQATRNVVCMSRLQQLGVGVSMYLDENKGCLPQLAIDLGGKSAIIGALFGGKRGTLPAFGINVYGAERRPLNRYLSLGAVPDDDEPGNFELEAFRSPADRGGVVPGFGRVPSFYDLLGASYTLNDHALDSESRATLVPSGGGKMPPIDNPSKTWVLGSHPIYNFQTGEDRGLVDWYGPRTVRATLLFADFHVGGPFTVPPGVENTTPEFRFLPRENWP
jgi:prepilin-type N-terminal cleavage/methylation domain-containing protein